MNTQEDKIYEPLGSYWIRSLKPQNDERPEHLIPFMRERIVNAMKCGQISAVIYVLKSDKQVLRRLVTKKDVRVSPRMYNIDNHQIIQNADEVSYVVTDDMLNPIFQWLRVEGLEWRLAGKQYKRRVSNVIYLVAYWSPIIVPNVPANGHLFTYWRHRCLRGPTNIDEAHFRRAVQRAMSSGMLICRLLYLSRQTDYCGKAQEHKNLECTDVRDCWTLEPIKCDPVWLREHLRATLRWIERNSLNWHLQVSVNVETNEKEPWAYLAVSWDEIWSETD